MKKKSPISIIISFIAFVIIASYLGLGQDNGLLSGIFDTKSNQINENGVYTSSSEVAEYIYTYHKLPSNYIRKDEARALGWNPQENYLGDIVPGKSIGGDVFQNFEKKLKDKPQRRYYEADIDYNGKERNAKRIIFSNDGLIYYTEDHYNTFKLLYDGSGKK